MNDYNNNFINVLNFTTLLHYHFYGVNWLETAVNKWCKPLSHKRVLTSYIMINKVVAVGKD